MAYPQVAYAANAHLQFGTSHPVPLPSPINAGDLLIILFAMAEFGFNWVINTPAGWTVEASASCGSADGEFRVFTRVADGSEGGSSVTITLSDGAVCSSQVYRITGWSGDLASGVDSASFVNAASSLAPPTVTASWGVAENLFIAIAGQFDDNTIIDSPADYGNEVLRQYHDASSQHSNVWESRRREKNDASDSPGNYVFSGADHGFAVTLVIRSSISVSPRLDIVPNASTRQAADWVSGFTTLPTPPSPSGGSDLVRFIR